MNIMTPNPARGRLPGNDPNPAPPTAPSGVLRFSPTTLAVESPFGPVVQKRGQVPNIPIAADQLDAMLREMKAHRAACG